MTADVVRFVDSIVASPTVRLDLNDEVKWWVKSFEANPPRLRRAMSSNAMSDGVFVSSSQYEARTLRIALDLRTSTQDDNATEIQKLARELDREDNFLMYQPVGMTKPVFFKLFRSDMSQIEQLTGPSAFRRPVIELLAEPFALGLREDAAPVTVTNDPAAGSNGCYFDVTGVIGDVPTPLVLARTNGGPPEYIALGVRQSGTPSDLVFFAQAESLNLFTDTTNPGGGPDAAMSGTGTNNYVTTSFATVASMTTRLTWDASSQTDAQRRALRGVYRVFLCVRRSDNTSVIKVQCNQANGPLSVVTTPESTSRTIIDMGVQSFGTGEPPRPGLGAADNPFNPRSLVFGAQRVSGTGTLSWDYVLLMPADSAVFMSTAATFSSAWDAVIDGVNSAYYATVSGTGNLFDGTADIYETSVNSLTFAGGIPQLVPNQVNRIVVVSADAQPGTSHSKSETHDFIASYWPRYLFVRPSAT